MAKTKPKFIIIDGNALVHRSFHALPPTITTKDGIIVNAVFGFTTALIKAIREFKPAYIALTLDKKGPTFRHKKFKEYKAKRIKAPNELYMQIPMIKKLAQSFNIPVYEMSGFEADDIIGTLAKKVNGEIEKIILTGDMDTLQLVNEHTRVYAMSRGITDSILYDIKAVKARYNLNPEQMIDYKSLRGDPSDNIPGVRGIGEKTAIELLSNFKSLDKVYENVEKNSKKLEDNFKPRVIGLLKEHKKEAYLSKELVTIKTNVGIDFKLEEAVFGGYRKDNIVSFLSEMEFRSLLPRVQALFNNQSAQTKEEKEQQAQNKFKRNKKQFKYELVDNNKKFNKFFIQLKKRKSFTFDTETSSLDPLTAELLGISFSWEKNKAFYILISDNKKQGNEDNLFNYQINKKEKDSLHPWLRKLEPIFFSEKIKKAGHNIKFDMRVMNSRGIEVRGIDFDTMVASYVLNPGTRQHNLDAVTFTELGFEKISKIDLLGKGRGKVSFSEVDMDKLMLYSCEDADFTNQLVKKLRPRLREQGLEKLFREIEMPLISVLAEMENIGVKLNKNLLAKMSVNLAKKIKELEKKIQKQAGMKFNISSTKQLQEVLFDKLEIPIDNIKRTKTGISTAAEELEKIKDLHPIVLLIQEYRELTKLTSTYVDALPILVNKKTKRLHTSFNQTITATGRLSSTEPNLQNIPIRTSLGKEIRKAFIAEKGFSLLSLDYSQIELRLAAHMSGDKKMIKAFKNGADIHTSTAAEINQVSPEAVTKNMRREAKAVNFGILYGQGPHGLSRGADIPYWRAKEFIDHYFMVYTGVKKWIDNSIKEAREKGCAATLLGRQRFLPNLNSSVAMVRKAAERMAINTPLQGTAADMIKIAMIEIAKKITTEEVRMILQVHDELLFEVRQDIARVEAQKIKQIMEKVIKLKVPVVVDVSIGNNWGEMKEIKKQ